MYPRTAAGRGGGRGGAIRWRFRDGILGHEFDKRLFYWADIAETILYSSVKAPYEKSAKQKNLSLFVNGIL
jgi:hypothetical protein